MQIRKNGFTLADAVMSSYHHRRYKMPLHIHQMAEIGYVFDGEIAVTVNGKCEIARRGDIVVVPPFTSHRYFSDDNKPISIWTFLFSYSILSNIMHEGEILTKYDSAVFTPSEEVRRLLESRMFDTNNDIIYPDVTEARRIRSFLYPIFDEYLNSVNVLDYSRGTGTDAMLKALNFMSDHFKENITLTDVAAAISYSTSHITHSFTSILGVSFRECLNMFRIEYAKRLILTTNMSIVLIGMESGFNCERSFHRAFMKSMNTTPTKYRNLHKKSLTRR